MGSVEVRRGSRAVRSRAYELRRSSYSHHARPAAAAGRCSNKVRKFEKLKPRGWVNDPNFKRAQHDRMSRNEMTNSDPRMSHYHESSHNPPNRTVSFARGTKSDSVSFSESDHD